MADIVKSIGVDYSTRKAEMAFEIAKAMMHSKSKYNSAEVSDGSLAAGITQVFATKKPEELSKEEIEKSAVAFAKLVKEIEDSLRG